MPQAVQSWTQTLCNLNKQQHTEPCVLQQSALTCNTFLKGLQIVLVTTALKLSHSHEGHPQGCAKWICTPAHHCRLHAQQQRETQKHNKWKVDHVCLYRLGATSQR